MKRAGEILQDLGFKQHASYSTKETFLRQLFKQTTGVKIQQKNSKSKEPSCVSKQLTFEFVNHSLQEAI